MTSPLRASVRDAFFTFNVGNEGLILFLYADSKNLITAGVGNLADTIPRALALPLRRPDGTLASPAEIEADWWAVRNHPDAARLGAPLAAKLTRLRMTREDVVALVAKRRDQNAAELARRFPGFPSWPASAQMATMSLAWAAGTGFAFPKCAAALAVGDFATAAVECKIDESKTKGVVHRNASNRALFLAAAWVADTGADPEPLRWAPPADEVPTPEPGPTLRDEAMRAWGMQIPVENEPPPSDRC